MGNQQEVGETEWAWLAGMMNGDGCFSLTLRKRDKRWKCDMSITLTQSDPCIIERASQILIDSIGCNPPIVEYPPTGAGTSPKFNMRISKMSFMVLFIERLLPYMCGVKKAKAKLMKRYLDNRMTYEGKSRKKNLITDDIKSIKIVTDFYELNNKPIPKEFAKVLRDHPQGVGPSGPKRSAPYGEDMVQSCARVQASEKMVSA
jgi:hypothetical protein